MMIDVIAKRRVTWNGTTYQKNEPVPMTAAEFDALAPIDRFERVPAKKVESKSKTTKKPEMTVNEYVDGYLAKRWGEDPPADVVQFASNNAAEIEKEFQRRAKVD